MKSEIVKREKYRGYEVIVKRIEWNGDSNFMPYLFDMNETPSNWEELMSLASYLNFKLGFWKGREELVGVVDEE